MYTPQLENAEPVVVQKAKIVFDDLLEYSEWIAGTAFQDITSKEIYSWIKNIKDPEYPLTLEELAVVQLSSVEKVAPNYWTIRFTPTVPHCSQAAMIGLMIVALLKWVLPPNVHVKVDVAEGTHNNASSISKQIQDKERVSAAVENKAVAAVIMKGLPKEAEATGLRVAGAPKKCEFWGEIGVPF